jgi:catechol 2,3-dioxygenase-like lactoylglutathione lyase family enzyme
MSKRCLRPALGALILLAGWGLYAAPDAPADSDKPAAPEAHFHHLHLNATDPAAAIDFYTAKFDCEKAKFMGAQKAVWAQKSWLLFHKVDKAPPWEFTSTIWHFGWGAEDMKAEYKRQLDMKTKFQTPITPLGTTFFYAYVDGPDHALIELNTANHHHFGHLHLLSEDPVAAGEWYIKHFGAKRRGTGPVSREPRFYQGFQVGPSMSLMLDNVNIIIFPVQYAKQAYAEQWKGLKEFNPTKGRVVDHVGISYEKLEPALDYLQKAGVKVTGPIQSEMGGKLRYAFIEGPDKMRIELVEGHAKKE